ncbi:MAG: thioredoxin family protein [Chlorobia bacterium]|nr:thioredoxin family protein [Fimbriimonadaceae bacterium]
MKISALLAICVFASVALPIIVKAQSAGTQVPTETREKFDPKRDAAKDIQKAVILAKKQNKRILLDVGGEWCGWCHKLDKFFKTDLEVAKVLKERFVVVKINFSPENENKAVLSKYPAAEGYPHLYVLDKNGKFLHSQGTGELETGDHHDHDKFMKFLKTWSS